MSLDIGPKLQQGRAQRLLVSFLVYELEATVLESISQIGQDRPK